MNSLDSFNNRILIVDDNPAIHEDFGKIFNSMHDHNDALAATEQALFGAEAAPAELQYVLESAYQGADALALTLRANHAGKPYALAFVDIRMPPGIDGIETIKELWKVCPEMQIAVCTAYSDYSWKDMSKSLGSSNKMLILKKPFDNIEVLQMASTLTSKWNLNWKRQQAEHEQRRLSDELREKNIALEVDIIARKLVEIELIDARKAAEQASEAKSMFLANMSHEIRTPLSAIMGYNYMIQKTELSDRQSGYTSKVDVAANSLLRLINSILDISKVEAGKIELEHIGFDLGEVLSKLTQMTSSLVQQKKLEFKVDVASNTPMRLIGDPMRLEQVLLNLSSNAIKFTEAGHVSVTVELIERTDRGLLLKFNVRDSGIGMRPSGLFKLFKPFVQADSTTTRKYGGTGLGLAISKQFVNLMGGELTVESHPGEGSIFSFTARFGEPAMAKLEQNMETQTKSEHTAGIEQRALLIDPIASSRTALTKILQELEFNVTACASREHSLIEIVRGGDQRPNKFDVLLIDESESERDWLTAVLNIREGFSDRVSPKIILIANANTVDQKMNYKNMGIDDVVFRPLTRSSVYDSIARAQLKGAERAKSVGAKAAGAHNRGNLLQGTRILLVDDDEINQQIANEILVTVGCDVTTVSSGAEALSKIFSMTADGRFHAVLMDLHMPDMDGLAATRQVRAEKRFADLPIIAMTADAIQGIRSNCLEAGMDDYLTKPINPDELFATLERWIPIARN